MVRAILSMLAFAAALAFSCVSAAQTGDAPQLQIGIAPGGMPTSTFDVDNASHTEPREQAGRANRGASLSSASPHARLPPVALGPDANSHDSPRDANADRLTAAEAIPLSRRPDSADADGSQPLDAASSLVTVGTSLAAVLGLFFALAYLVRRNLPKGVQPPPGEVLEVLGRAPLPGKQQLQVVRFGSKLVLLSVTADGVEAVSEITQPDEVQQLTALCRRETPGSSAHAFQEILTQMGREPARGFLDQRIAAPAPARQ